MGKGSRYSTHQHTCVACVRFFFFPFMPIIFDLHGIFARVADSIEILTCANVCCCCRLLIQNAFNRFKKR